MFSSNTDSLGYQFFKGASWALVSGLHLGDTIDSTGPVFNPVLGLRLGPGRLLFQIPFFLYY